MYGEFLILFTKRFSCDPFGLIPTSTEDIDSTCEPNTSPREQLALKLSTMQSGDELITLGKVVCAFTVTDNLPIVPAVRVETPIRNVAFDVILTTVELDDIEQLIVLGLMTSEPEFMNDVAPLNPWIVKLSEYGGLVTLKNRV